MQIKERSYSERTATVAGGEGALGSKVARNLRQLGFKEVKICEKDDRFVDFVVGSTDLWIATNAIEAKLMLAAARDFLRPGDHTISDGASVKEPLVSSYREFDGLGISVCSTHLGAIPAQPWSGIKSWICVVGPNSERAKALNIDMYLSKNCSIRTIDIEDHKNVQEVQWYTFALMYVLAKALQENGRTLENFDSYATLNSELLALPLGRTLGQGKTVPSEILNLNSERDEFNETLTNAFRDFSEVLKNRSRLEQFIQDVIDFHESGNGSVKKIFKKAGIIGARNANMRLHSLSFKVVDRGPGYLRELLQPFYQEGANILGVDSMPSEISKDFGEEVDPESVIEFDFAIDPTTINSETENRIKSALEEMGCIIDASRVKM